MCDFDTIDEPWEEYEYGLINNHEIINGQIWVQVNWKAGTKKFGQIIPLELIRKDRNSKIQNYLKKLENQKKTKEITEFNKLMNPNNL